MSITGGGNDPLEKRVRSEPWFHGVLTIVLNCGNVPHSDGTTGGTFFCSFPSSKKKLAAVNLSTSVPALSIEPHAARHIRAVRCLRNVRRRRGQERQWCGLGLHRSPRPLEVSPGRGRGGGRGGRFRFVPTQQCSTWKEVLLEFPAILKEDRSDYFIFRRKVW